MLIGAPSKREAYGQLECSAFGLVINDRVGGKRIADLVEPYMGRRVRWRIFQDGFTPVIEGVTRVGWNRDLRAPYLMPFIDERAQLKSLNGQEVHLEVLDLSAVTRDVLSLQFQIKRTEKSHKARYKGGGGAKRLPELLKAAFLNKVPKEWTGEKAYLGVSHKCDGYSGRIGFNFGEPRLSSEDRDRESSLERLALKLAMIENNMGEHTRTLYLRLLD